MNFRLIFIEFSIVGAYVCAFTHVQLVNDGRVHIFRFFLFLFLFSFPSSSNAGNDKSEYLFGKAKKPSNRTRKKKKCHWFASHVRDIFTLMLCLSVDWPFLFVFSDFCQIDINSMVESNECRVSPSSEINATDHKIKLFKNSISKRNHWSIIPFSSFGNYSVRFNSMRHTVKSDTINASI